MTIKSEPSSQTHFPFLKTMTGRISYMAPVYVGLSTFYVLVTVVLRAYFPSDALIYQRYMEKNASKVMLIEKLEPDNLRNLHDLFFPLEEAKPDMLLTKSVPNSHFVPATDEARSKLRAGVQMVGADPTRAKYSVMLVEEK